MNKLESYYDIITLLGRVSFLVESNYDRLSDDQLDSIHSYFQTILFHISNEGDRARILTELETVAANIGNILEDS